MALLLRVGALVSVISSLLVFASVVTGRLSASIILVSSQEVEGHLYILYVMDWAQDIRVNVAGTRCAEPPPAWVYPNWDSAPPPIHYHSRSFLKRITDLREVLPLCDPLMP